MSSRRAVLVFVVLIAVLGASVLIAVLAIQGPSRPTPASTVLIFNVPSQVEESHPPANGVFDLLRSGRPTVWALAHGLRHAATDPHIVALVLHIDDVEWGWAKVAEIRDAVAEFRRVGKPVYASLSGGGEHEYLLASIADTIACPPLGLLQLDGLTASALFLRGTFDKVGITPNFAQAGRFKSATEMWMRTGMSPPAREALEELVDDAYGLFADSVGRARDLPPDSVKRLLDDGPYGAREARACGLIDTLLHRPEVDTLAVHRGGGRRPTLTLTRYLDRIDSPRVGPHIALITAAGTIADGRSRGGPGEGDVLGSETIIKALRDVAGRHSIRGVVLRIDSPGGSAQAADDIWREVKRCAARKPLVVSMSDLAASGGYYIAAPADSIVAEPGTLTGSIGAFGGKLNLLGLYHKLGLNVETVSRGRHAEMFSPYRDFTVEEAGRFQSQMDEVYRVFLSRVSEGRHQPTAAVDSVGQGHVWTGLAARRLGLVDGLGGIDRAVQMARRRAGIADDEEVTVDVVPRPERTFLQGMLADLIDEDGTDEDANGAMSLPPVVQAWLAAATFPSGVALTLMPWSIEFR
ncbi:MAG: signal peptide peptidase SppA [Candidatus Eisenbacteria bacterium]|uniref:Signal peptide peptidase SppA n=1 Tax=Eiseniibacteriota bacterium TaxID=2212470 RepID=A0A538U933_UNCEI|nr:MAG: signal peptide peptidase SppA [Candidatus Eisenbacteria bacterium]